jgi:hypothetical protein
VIGVMKRQGTLFGMSMDNRAFAPARSPMGRMVNPQGIVDRVLVKPLDSRHAAGAAGHRGGHAGAQPAAPGRCEQLRHRDGNGVA